MSALQNLLVHGVGFGDAALLAIRLSVGAFFVFSGFHKLFNPIRRQELRATFAADGVKLPVMMYVVPLGEFLGGLGLAFGALTVFAAFGLCILNIGAILLDGSKRVRAMQALDRADRIDDVLYLPEVLYVVSLLAVLSFGPGAFSLDALAWRA